ncbi:MAG: hypothetical protein D6695_01825 [Planctomycetota bacterium]|nr:MAG: hypothetical protein D6695_01825 [Planctomycetota bacterium]
MKPRSNRSLVALNIALVLVLGAVSLPRIAGAQNERSRSRGEYTMVEGVRGSGSSNAVYILDSVNAEMIVLLWDQGRRTLQGIGFRDLEDDVQAQIRR